MGESSLKKILLFQIKGPGFSKREKGKSSKIPPLFQKEFHQATLHGKTLSPFRGKCFKKTPQKNPPFLKKSWAQFPHKKVAHRESPGDHHNLGGSDNHFCVKHPFFSRRRAFFFRPAHQNGGFENAAPPGRFRPPLISRGERYTNTAPLRVAIYQGLA